MATKKVMKMEADELRQLIELALICSGSVAALSRDIKCCRSAITNWLDGTCLPRRNAVAKLKAFIAQQDLTKHGIGESYAG